MPTIICPRHNRTDLVLQTSAGPVCAHPRAAHDLPPHVDLKSPAQLERARLRAALQIPEDKCGRFGLPECAACAHPAHQGGKCSTMVADSAIEDGGTKWCGCDLTPKEG